MSKTSDHHLKASNKIGITLSGDFIGRPPVKGQGANQGGHVIPYDILVKQVSIMKKKAQNEKKLSDIPMDFSAITHMISLFESLPLHPDETHHLVEDIKNRRDAVIRESGYHTFIALQDDAISKITDPSIRKTLEEAKEGALASYLKNIEHNLEKLIQTVSIEFLTLFNQQPGISYPSQHQKNKSYGKESGTIKGSINALQALHADYDGNDQIMDKVASHIVATFDYHFLSQKQLLSQEERQKLIRERKVKDASYFRDNSIDGLAKAISLIIKNMELLFPMFFDAPSGEKLIEKIIDHVITEKGWSKHPNLKRKELDQKVQEALPSYLQEAIIIDTPPVTPQTTPTKATNKTSPNPSPGHWIRTLTQNLQSPTPSELDGDDEYSCALDSPYHQLTPPELRKYRSTKASNTENEESNTLKRKLSFSDNNHDQEQKNKKPLDNSPNTVLSSAALSQAITPTISKGYSLTSLYRKIN